MLPHLHFKDKIEYNLIHCNYCGYINCDVLSRTLRRKKVIFDCFLLQVERNKSVVVWCTSISAIVLVRPTNKICTFSISCFDIFSKYYLYIVPGAHSSHHSWTVHDGGLANPSTNSKSKCQLPISSLFS